MDEEEIEIGFKLLSDTFILTSKRLIIIDKQGSNGSLNGILQSGISECISIQCREPGKVIFDLDVELKIRVSCESHPSIVSKFNKAVDVYEMQKLLAKYVL